jgi:hypothetical protein
MPQPAAAHGRCGMVPHRSCTASRGVQSRATVEAPPLRPHVRPATIGHNIRAGHERNSLKEIARWLGFDWTWLQASGTAAMFLRRCWELTFDDRVLGVSVPYEQNSDFAGRHQCPPSLLADALAGTAQ